MASPSIFFWRCYVSLVKFRYWSKFHVNITNGSGIMTIPFNKGLTRNLEIGNSPIWVLSNVWRLGRVTNTKFGTNVSNKILLNAAKCQGCSLYRFWVIRGKPTGGVKLPLPPTQIRVNLMWRTIPRWAFISKVCIYDRNKWMLQQQLHKIKSKQINKKMINIS